MNENPLKTLGNEIKRQWGLMVFRYAGRNPCSQNSIQSRRFYNIVSRVYDWLYAEQLPGYQKAVEYVIQQYIEPNQRILDLGCGTGIFAEKAVGKYAFFVGSDLSFGMIQEARDKNKYLPNVHWVVNDCRALSFHKTFDVIVSCFMLVILKREQQREVIRDLFPLLREGGKIIFLSANDDYSSQWLSCDEWRKYCESAGFENFETNEILEFYRVILARKPKKLADSR